MKINAARIAALSLLSLATAAGAAEPTLHIDAATSTGKVSPTLYGLMTEEINFSYDGGLYGELIRNRNFKEDLAGPAHWSLLQDEKGRCTATLSVNLPLSAALPVSLKLDATSLRKDQRVAIANEGYWGIPVRPNAAYRASFYAKSSVFGSRGPLTVSLESNDGKTIFAKADVERLTTDWQQYNVTLTAPADITPTTDNHFVISTGSAGTYWFNLVSLFPPTYNNRPNGLRLDLMQMLIDMKPAFLRFPGGNFLEGDTIEERFDWKNTIGPLIRRSGHPSPWRYPSTDGMGLLEYLEWTQDMHAQPVLAVFAGYALHKQYVPAGPELQLFVQEALDEIEYVTGDKSTKWGAQRIADGHPEPFPLTYVEIGNEDQYDKSGSYDGRFSQFYDAIKAKYPKLQLIATTRVKSRTPDVVDDHYYRQAVQFEKDTHHYDKHDRNGPKVFVGEWATREGVPTTNFNAALGDAAWMTGMERNSDLIVMSCYAPLFVNVNPGGMQWKSDLIGYNALSSYGSPSYYAQKLFNTHLGDTMPASTIADVPTSDKGVDQLFYSVTRDSNKGTLYLKVVNISATEQPVRLEIAGEPLADQATQIVLSAKDPHETNSITDPMHIVPVSSTITGISRNFIHTFAPYSITILELNTAGQARSASAEPVAR